MITVTAFIPEYQTEILQTWRSQNHPFQFCGESAVCETFDTLSFDVAREKMSRLLIPLGLRIKRVEFTVQPERVGSPC